MSGMNNFNETDHPRQKTGRFAEKQQNAPEVDLPGSDVDRELSGAKDLARANLCNADLCWADLRKANLTGANLRWADLHGAKLSGANLTGADLTGAKLGGANLSGADLRGAKLGGADLVGAKIQWAEAHRANLHGAVADTHTVWPAGFDPTGRGVIEEASDE